NGRAMRPGPMPSSTAIGGAAGPRAAAGAGAAGGAAAPTTAEGVPDPPAEGVGLGSPVGAPAAAPPPPPPAAALLRRGRLWPALPPSGLACDRGGAGVCHLGPTAV